MKDNLVNPVVSPSNLTLDGEIEFSVNPSNHLISSYHLVSPPKEHATHLLIISSHSFINSTST